MGTRAKRMEGMVFGRLTVLSENGRTKQGWLVWLCKCSCGSTVSVQGPSLRAGNTRSCGCLKREVIKAGANLKHGMEGTPTWHSWAGMIQRCTNPNHPRYSDYGGRGIQVCERWRKFDNFLEDMGTKPGGKTLDRIKNELGYGKGNCRWATKVEQANNCRSNVVLTYRGEKRTQAEWSKACGVDQRKVSNRIRVLGWSVERALTTP